METQPTFTNRLDLSHLQQSAEKVRQEMGRVIIGQSDMIELLLVALIAKGHVLLEGVPGVAKTLTTKLLASAVNTEFSRIQFTPDLMPSDVLGTSVFNMKDSSFELKRGPIFSNLILIDEINRAPAKTQAALFEVMEERQVTLDGHTYAMAEPYMVMATQNPIEQEGTYRLPEAQLDRFLFKIEVGYPTPEEEVKMLEGHHKQEALYHTADIEAVLSAQEIAAAQQAAQQVHLSPDMLQYIVKLVAETRNHPDFYLGASPRASVALLNAGKAYAALQGRDFVTPEDVQFLLLPVLRHRVMLTPEREMEGIQVADVIQQLIDKVEVPR
jgi:MoxR-like ATPase